MVGVDARSRRLRSRFNAGITCTLDAERPIRRHPCVFQRIRGHYRFMNRFWRQIGGHLRGPVGVFLATATITSITVVTIALYTIERDANVRLDTWFDALYLTMTTMTGVGYGDVAPITTAGRTVAMFAMLFGTAIFAGFTALFASAILEIGRSRSWEHTDERA